MGVIQDSLSPVHSTAGINVWLPHIIAGVGVIVLVLVSQTRYQPRAGALV